MHGKRFLPPALLVLGGLVSAAGGAQEQEAQVRHQLEVETGGGTVRVRLLVENRGYSPLLAGAGGPSPPSSRGMPASSSRSSGPGSLPSSSASTSRPSV